VIIGRREIPISCGMRTLYRKFKSGEFNQENLPMQGKRKPNGHQEKRGKQSFRRSIRDRDQEHPHYQVIWKVTLSSADIIRVQSSRWLSDKQSALLLSNLQVNKQLTSKTHSTEN